MSICKPFVSQVSKCTDVLSCLAHEEVTEWRSAKCETPVISMPIINSLYGDAGSSGIVERKYSAAIRTPSYLQPFVIHCVRKVALHLDCGTIPVQACINARGHYFQHLL
jgi:hypothetical protein